MAFLQTIEHMLKKVPGMRQLVWQLRRRHLLQYRPRGHFYSPFPSISDIQRNEVRIFANVPRMLKCIDLQESQQMALVEECLPYYAELPFTALPTQGLRYFFENPMYSYSDAIFLYCMIRRLRPRRIIEVGSGYSSCVILDTNELFFNSSIQTTFVEPHPERFLSLIKDSDKRTVRMISRRLQDTDPRIFEELESNDILFVDSTHVSKVDSDVNHIFFNILPRLARGVHIHFHDIPYPFEYPKEWVYEGRAWTEAYLLRSFLECNTCFTVVLMNTFLEYFHREWFERKMPLCLKDTGCSIWIRREI
jgi:hypothetical protein